MRLRNAINIYLHPTEKTMSTDPKLHLQQQLAASRAELMALLESLQPAQWEVSVFSEGDPWTVNTLVGHLNESERGMSIQIHKTRKGVETLPLDFNLARWNGELKQRIGTPSPSELLDNLVITRAKTLEMMDTLTADDWSRIGRHPSRGLITIEQYYETIHGHELTHTADIKRALAALV